MALPQPNVGDQNRWSLSNNAPFFLCISVILWCGKEEVGEGLEKVSERGRGGKGTGAEPVALWKRNASLKANKGLWREAAPVSQSKMDAF